MLGPKAPNDERVVYDTLHARTSCRAEGALVAALEKCGSRKRKCARADVNRVNASK